MLHEGTLPTDAAGHVVMDYLPTPVLGTFWPYSSNKDAKLAGVVAGQRRVLVEETALTLAQLLEGNAGAEAILTEKIGGANREPVRYACTIVGIPERSGEELAATAPPNSTPRAPEKGSVVLVRTADGVKVVAIENIQDVTFTMPHRNKLSHEEFRNLLTLKLDWGSRRPASSTDVGLVYLQKGVRWIPSYKVTLDGTGNAAIKLQTTLLNELADIEDVTANLVIRRAELRLQGHDGSDIPGAVGGAVVAAYFQRGDRMSSLSNAIMSQVPSGGRARRRVPAQPAECLDPTFPNRRRARPFNVHGPARDDEEGRADGVACRRLHDSLQGRLHVGSTFAPPRRRTNLNTEQEAATARLLERRKLFTRSFHQQGRLSVDDRTGPDRRDNRVLAQGTMTYTAIGASSDLGSPRL